VPRDEAALLDLLLAHPKLRQALGQPIRTFGRCSGCGEYARCVEGVGVRFCEGCGPAEPETRR
jgi:hypothetical protein